MAKNRDISEPKAISKEFLLELMKSDNTRKEIRSILGMKQSEVSDLCKSLNVTMKPRTSLKKGDVFGRWTVLEYSHENNNIEYYKCVCNCGKVSTVNVSHLKAGRSLSCGCLHIERARESAYRHGYSKQRLYTTWIDMKERCYNTSHKKYHRYGGRGITVCEDWHELSNFYNWAINNGHSNELTIDRINNDLGYCPENCRFTDSKTQANNRSTNRRYEYNGFNLSLTEWCRKLDLEYEKVRSKIRSGKSFKEAVSSQISPNREVLDVKKT